MVSSGNCCHHDDRPAPYRFNRHAYFRSNLCCRYCCPEFSWGSPYIECSWWWSRQRQRHNRAHSSTDSDWPNSNPAYSSPCPDPHYRGPERRKEPTSQSIPYRRKEGQAGGQSSDKGDRVGPGRPRIYRIIGSGGSPLPIPDRWLVQECESVPIITRARSLAAQCSSISGHPQAARLLSVVGWIGRGRASCPWCWISRHRMDMGCFGRLGRRRRIMVVAHIIPCPPTWSVIFLPFSFLISAVISFCTIVSFFNRRPGQVFADMAVRDASSTLSAGGRTLVMTVQASTKSYLILMRGWQTWLADF